MSLPVLDLDGRSTIAAAEAQAALVRGDTSRARDKYGEAGQLLKMKIASTRSPSEKHLFRFLAASQYYHGGQYSEALHLCRQIEERLLPAEVKHLFSGFFLHVKARSASDYAKRVREDVFALYKRGEYTAVLDKLVEHPFVISPSKLAFLRADLCEKLGKYRAAAAFFADAVRLNPEHPEIIFTAQALPLLLPSQGKLDQAWEYSQILSDVLPHPITEMVVSILCLHRAASVRNEDRARFVEQQYRCFEKARLGFEQLPVKERSFVDSREIMKLGFGAMHCSLWRMGDVGRAKLVCDQAIAFEPFWGEAWERRGSVRYPQPEAVEDFRKAIELGDNRYFPYLYLAHNAMGNGDFRSALPLIEQALRARIPPGRRVRAQLQSWLAICNNFLGADREVVNAHFVRALEIDPDYELVREGYNEFLNSTTKRESSRLPELEDGELRQGDIESITRDHQPKVGEAIASAKPALLDLQLAA